MFSVERFHEYLYGRRFIVINDQRPLKSIFNRLQFLALLASRIFFYAFKITTSNFDIHTAKTCLFQTFLADPTLAIPNPNLLKTV